MIGIHVIMLEYLVTVIDFVTILLCLFLIIHI